MGLDAGERRFGSAVDHDHRSRLAGDWRLVLGLLVGINLIMSGWAIVMMGFAGRQLTKTGTKSTLAHQP